VTINLAELNKAAGVLGKWAMIISLPKIDDQPAKEVLRVDFEATRENAAKLVQALSLLGMVGQSIVKLEEYTSC
jgi:hypothetical protein